MIGELQPYLYVTTEIIWWCWTSLASGWIEEQNSNVIRAACVLAGVHWEDGLSPYTVYEHDISSKVRWKTRKNTAADEELVDINYIQLEGSSLQNICRAISSKTSPHLDWTDVMGVMNVLTTTQVAPQGGAFLPQPKSRLKAWHKYTTLPTKGPDGSAVDGVKTVSQVGSNTPMPDEYLVNNPDPTMPRGEDDMPRASTDSMMPVIDLSDMNGTSKKLYIMPSVCGSYRNKTIVSALLYATMNRTFPEGKILLGTPTEEDAMQMQVFPCPRQLIDRAVRQFDADVGYDVGADGKPVWKGDPSIEEDERPVSRQVGISFNRRGGISTADQDFFTAVPSMPVADGDMKWAARSMEDISGMDQARDICIDLDYESAKRQHMACGRGIDEVILTPAFIRERYIQACRAIDGRVATLDKDYPHDWLPEAEKRKAIWDSSAATKHAALISDDIYKMGMETHNQPRKSVTAQRIQERKTMTVSRRRDRDSRESLLSSGGETLPSFTDAAVQEPAEPEPLPAMPTAQKSKPRSAMLNKKQKTAPPPPPRSVAKKKIAAMRSEANAE